MSEMNGIIIAYGALAFLLLIGTMFGYFGTILMTRKYPQVNTMARDTVNRYAWLSIGAIIFELLAVVFQTLAYATNDIPQQGFDIFRALYKYSFYTAATLFLVRSFHFSYLMIKRCAQTSILSFGVANFFKWTFRLFNVVFFLLWIMVFAEPLFLGFISLEHRTEALRVVADITTFLYGGSYITVSVMQFLLAIFVVSLFTYYARKQHHHATTFAQESMTMSSTAIKALFATQFLTLMYCITQSVLFIVDWTMHDYPSMQVQEWFGVFVLRVTAIIIFNIGAMISLHPRLLSDIKPATTTTTEKETAIVMEEGISAPSIVSVA